MASKALNEYVLLGRSGLRVSPLCLGTMTFGTKWNFGSSRDEAHAVFTEYVKRGGNFIDTANKYHEGESETWLGEFMEAAGNRDDLVIATKFSLPMSSSASLVPEGAATSMLPGVPPVYNPVNSAGNSRKNLFRSVEASLKRLRTSYIGWFSCVRSCAIARACDCV